MCVFQSVPLFFYIILFQLIKVDSQIDYLQTDSLPNSLRFINFGSEMDQNCQADKVFLFFCHLLFMDIGQD